MARVGVFVCHCGSNIARHGRLRRGGRGGAADAGRRLRLGLQVHVLRARAEADPGHDRGREARPRRRRLVLAAHARADLPAHGGRGRRQPVPHGDGEPARALLVGARRQARGHGQGRRDRGHAGRQGAARRGPQARARRAHQAAAGDRRRHRRDPGGARRGERRLRGDARRAHADDRRQDGDARQDLPDARLLGLHPDAADGRRRAAPEDPADDLGRGRGGARLRRQLRRDRAPEGALRRPLRLQRLRHVLGQVPGEGRPERVRPGRREAAPRSTCPSRRRSPTSP